jgi:P-type conjugative transfer protein VirB9
MKRSVLAFALAATCAFVSASQVPKGSKFDGRIQYVNYNAGDVVEVYAVAGIASRLVFAPGETILDVASGFTQGWEFSDRRNILYIKAKSIKGDNGQAPMRPMPRKWDTNLMVTTNLRMYDIDLHLVAAGERGKAGSPRVTYRVEFRYPTDDAALAKAAADKVRLQAKLEAKPQPRNWNYSMQVGDDSDDIAPTAAYDDGRFTYLRFPNNRDFPAAFVVSPDKSESLVNSHVAPDDPGLLVLHRVSHQVVLRLGRSVVAVYNDSYDADGVPAKSGMTVPGVKRILKSAEGGK